MLHRLGGTVVEQLAKMFDPSLELLFTSRYELINAVTKCGERRLRLSLGGGH